MRVEIAVLVWLGPVNFEGDRLSERQGLVSISKHWDSKS